MLEATINRLDKARAEYFSDVLRKLKDDSRTERMPNMVYLILKETVMVLPIYLPKRELIDQLFVFLESNHNRLGKRLFDKKYINDPSFIRAVTNDFVHAVVDEIFERYKIGEIDGDEQIVHHFTWPYHDVDFPYQEDEEED